MSKHHDSYYLPLDKRFGITIPEFVTNPRRYVMKKEVCTMSISAFQYYNRVNSKYIYIYNDLGIFGDNNDFHMLFFNYIYIVLYEIHGSTC